MADSVGIPADRLAELAVVCVCGHERRFHFGDEGPCVCAYRPDDAATVCPCSAFKARGTE